MQVIVKLIGVTFVLVSLVSASYPISKSVHRSKADLATTVISDVILILTIKNIGQVLTSVLDWHTLGRNLGLQESSLGAIRIDHSAYGTDRQRSEMIASGLHTTQRRHGAS